MLSIKRQASLGVRDLIHDVNQKANKPGMGLVLSIEMQATLSVPGLICCVDQKADQPR